MDTFPPTLQACTWLHPLLQWHSNCAAACHLDLAPPWWWWLWWWLLCVVLMLLEVTTS